MSHINSVVCKGLHDKSAYDVFTNLFSKELADAFGVSYINPLAVPGFIEREDYMISVYSKL